jgi:hypothetical protein
MTIKIRFLLVSVTIIIISSLSLRHYNKFLEHIWGGIAFPRKQSDRDRDFMATRLLPLADFVRSFKKANRRMPTQSEFRAWANEGNRKDADYYSTQPDDFYGWGVEGEDFLVGSWRGEWKEYLQSSNGRVYVRYYQPFDHADGDR